MSSLPEVKETKEKEVKEREVKEPEVNFKEQMDQLSKELHKPFSKKFPRLHVRAPDGMDSIWSCDLVDMQEWKDDNDGYRFMLNCVDVWSRYAFSRPLKSKSATDVYAAFIDIVETSGRQPKALWVDEGKEFYNNVFKTWMRANDCTMYSTYGEHKSVICERFNRTLKFMMWKRFDSENTRSWIEMLPELIKKYNFKKHIILGTTPYQATLPVYKDYIEKRVNPLLKKDGVDRIPKFKIGDIVRISRVKRTFEKGYLANWSRETFKVNGIRTPDDAEAPITYTLVDMMDDPIKGSWYTEELQPVKNPDFILIEKTIKEKKVNGKDMILVKYLGWPDKFNKWIPKEEGKEI